MLRKFALALSLTALLGTAGVLAASTQAEAGWHRSDRVVHRTTVMGRRDWRPAHFAPRWHRHGCVVKRHVRFTPRGPVKVVKRACY